MAEKRITVKTSSNLSPHGYKIDSNGDKFWVYHLKGVGLFSNDWYLIGTTRSQEEAIAIIRSHASQFGTIRDLEIR
jgi:hypothetical protein